MRYLEVGFTGQPKTYVYKLFEDGLAVVKGDRVVVHTTKLKADNTPTLTIGTVVSTEAPPPPLGSIVLPVIALIPRELIDDSAKVVYAAIVVKEDVHHG